MQESLDGRVADVDGDGVAPFLVPHIKSLEDEVEQVWTCFQQLFDFGVDAFTQILVDVNLVAYVVAYGLVAYCAECSHFVLVLYVRTYTR